MKSTAWACAASALGLAVLASAAAADPPPAQPQTQGPSHIMGTTAGDATNLSTAASGDVVVNVNPQAAACQEAAKFGDFNNNGVDECTLALRAPLMSSHDLAATYTDRGAIRMQHKQYTLAKTDFDQALTLDPNLANAYVDRGGALIAEKRYVDAIADIDRGLALNPDEPEKAWFNRGIAHEGLKDLKSALADYQKALELKPEWAAAKAELTRFTSTPVTVSEP
jgi:tetratricopeptide (TPR) repeat protein